MNKTVAAHFVGDVLSTMVADSNRTIHDDDLVLSREIQIISKDDEEYDGNETNMST